jgi:hypothetical protein
MVGRRNRPTRQRPIAAGYDRERNLISGPDQVEHQSGIPEASPGGARRGGKGRTYLCPMIRKNSTFGYPNHPFPIQ